MTLIGLGPLRADCCSTTHGWCAQVLPCDTTVTVHEPAMAACMPERIKCKLCVLVHRCLNGAWPQYLSELIQPLSDVDSVTSSTTFCIHGWSSGAGYAALNHWRPCSCRRWSTCLEQSSSRSAPIPDIFYFQNTPEVTYRIQSHVYPSLQFDSIIIDYFWTEPLKPIVPIRLSKFVIITLHYVTSSSQDRWAVKRIIGTVYQMQRYFVMLFL